MSWTQAFFGLYADGPGKKVQSAQLTDSNNNIVYRQIGGLGDPSDPSGVMAVKEGGVSPVAATDGAAVVVLRPDSTLLAVAVAPIATSAAATSLVLKASAGNLLTLACAPEMNGYLMLFDALAAPADGIVTPKWCQVVSAFGQAAWTWPNPLGFANGIVAVFSLTGPFTKTSSATAFISGQAQ